MIILSSSTGKSGLQRLLPLPPIQPSFILQRYVVIKNGSLGCIILFLCKVQPLAFLVLFRAMWALEEFNQSGNFRQRGSVNQILPKCNRLSFTGIALNSINFLFPTLPKEAKRAKKLLRITGFDQHV